ncbi:MAG: hypothetical protein IPG61_12470 [bacterium]|nr:hypothetical protein [bacterium]
MRCRAWGSLRPRPGTPVACSRAVFMAACAVLVLALAGTGCAKYNTYYNAKRAFDNAERVREDALRKNQDPPKPAGAQKTDYETAIAKAQKVLDEYPGHKLSDDALFLRAKAYYRLESYRMSIRQFDLLFQNFPASEYLEESLYLQSLNYLLIGALDRSQDYLGQLERAYPDSRYQAEVSRVSGDNAYALEDWEGARTAYRQYLALGDEARDRDRVALKLADCLWELDRYAEADTVLTEMLAEVAPGELKFRAELLRGRVLARSGALDQADKLLDGLDQAAAFHKAEGELALVKSEVLVSRGKADDAAALLQAMPTEWQTPVVKARVADVLGYRFLERQEYAEAHEQFKIALGQRNELDEPEKTRSLNEQLKDYLAAERDLAEAPPERVPRLKLLQANAMLFGFDRAAQAAALYREAAADTAADSLLASRALYGLWLAYGQKLGNPDSAKVVADELLERFPASAQAREVRAEGGGGLLEFLLAERELVQQRNLANLTADERRALEEIVTPTIAGTGGRPGSGPPARRRMIYFARREPLSYPPPEIVIPIGGPSAADVRIAAPADAATGADGPVAPGADASSTVKGASESGAAAGAEAGSGEQAKPVDGAMPVDATKPDAEAKPVDEAKPVEPEQPKKERDPNWDRLRSPAPGPAQ